MQKYVAIENGIAKNDVNGLREAIGSICYTSRDFSSGEFDEIVRYVTGKGVQLKDEPLKGMLVSTGKTMFTDEDYARAIFELKKNFCDERINDVKAIGKVLYKKPTYQPKSEAKTTPNYCGATSPNVQSHQKTNYIPVVAVVLVAVAVIAVLVYLLKK